LDVDLPEIEKCMKGEWYDCHDPILVEMKANARRLLARYNLLSYDDRTDREELLRGISINKSFAKSAYPVFS
jgi:hypothetical protein